MKFKNPILETLYNNKWKYCDELKYYEIEKSNLKEDEICLYTSEYGLEHVDGCKVRLNCDQRDFYIFNNITDFLRLNRKNNFTKSIAVISEKLFYDIRSEITYENFNINNDYKIIQNAQYYHKTLEILKNNEHKGDRNFYFTDYFSYDRYKFILTSVSKVGQLTITFNPNFNINDNNIIIKEGYNRLSLCLSKDSMYLSKFLKTEMFIFLSKEGRTVIFDNFILNIDTIIDTAEQNLDIFLSGISMENIKSEYTEYKNKYFSQLRDILNKITNQILAFPITISATAFATYKISDSSFTIILVLIVFSTITIYSIFLFKIQKSDIEEINDMLDRDFDKLKNNDFFKRRPTELNDFDNIKIKLYQRIRLIKITHLVYIILVSIINSTFIGFLTFQLFHNLLLPVIVSGTLMVIFASIVLYKYCIQ